MADYKGLKERPRLFAKKMKLKTYKDGPIETVEVCKVSVVVAGEQYKVQFTVIPHGSPSIFGANDSERLGLVSRAALVRKVYSVMQEVDMTLDNIRENYQEIFQGLGCLEGKCTIHLKENSVPSVYPARKVPLALRGKLKEELRRLEKMGVIKKWFNPQIGFYPWCL